MELWTGLQGVCRGWLREIGREEMSSGKGGPLRQHR